LLGIPNAGSDCVRTAHPRKRRLGCGGRRLERRLRLYRGFRRRRGLMRRSWKGVLTSTTRQKRAQQDRGPTGSARN
jgi:hypothetical protein